MTPESNTAAEQHEFPNPRWDEGCMKCGGFEGEPCEPPAPSTEMSRMLDQLEKACSARDSDGVMIRKKEALLLFARFRSLQAKLEESQIRSATHASNHSQALVHLKAIEAKNEQQDALLREVSEELEKLLPPTDFIVPVVTRKHIAKVHTKLSSTLSND